MDFVFHSPQAKRALKRRPFKTSINYSLRLRLEESQTEEEIHLVARNMRGELSQTEG